jgi:hypothetical protein
MQSFLYAVSGPCGRRVGTGGSTAKSPKAAVKHISSMLQDLVVMDLKQPPIWRPDKGWIKVNTDGAFDAKTGNGYWGWVRLCKLAQKRYTNASVRQMNSERWCDVLVGGMGCFGAQIGTSERKRARRTRACSLGLSATSQQYFFLRTNQPPTTSQQYFSLRTNQHQPSANRTGWSLRWRLNGIRSYLMCLRAKLWRQEMVYC